MLNLKRSKGEGVIIGENAEVRLWFLEGEAKVAFDCEQDVYRAELWLARKVAENQGRITPEMRSVIEDMKYYCPWRLNQVDMREGRLVKDPRSAW